MAPPYPGALAVNRTSSGPLPPGDLIDLAEMDRRLAYKNLRTALIAGAVSVVVFALSWVVGLVY